MNDLKMGFKHTLLQRLHGLEMIIPQRPDMVEESHYHNRHHHHHLNNSSNNNDINRVSETNAQTVHAVTDFSIQKILGDKPKTDKSSHEKNDTTATRIAKNILSASTTYLPKSTTIIKTATEITESTKMATITQKLPTVTPTTKIIIADTTTTTATTTLPPTTLTTPTISSSISTTTTTTTTTQFQIIHPVAKKPFNNSDILDLSTNKSQQYPYISPSQNVNHATNQYNCLQARTYENFHPSNVLAAMAAVNAQKFYAQFLPQMFAAGFYNNCNNNISSSNNNNNIFINDTVSHQNRLTQQQSHPQIQTSTVPTSITTNYTKRYFAPYVINPSNNHPTQTNSTVTSTIITPTITSSSLTQTRITSRENNCCSTLSTSQSTITNRGNRLNSCNRLNCLECLNAYYRHVSSTFNRYPLNASIALPANTNLSATGTNVNTIIGLTTNNANLYRQKMKTSKDAILISSLPNVSSPSSPQSSITPSAVITSNTIPRRTITNPLQLVTTNEVGLVAANPPVLFHPTNPLPSNMEEISYKCCICEKVFGCSQTLQAHEKTHKSPRYECSDCGKGFSQLRNYKYHLSVHRGTKEFAAECPECRKTFNDKGYLSSHMKIHRNKKEYQCPYCPKSFNQRVAFNMHVRIHTGVKPHKCVECGKRFSRKMLLKQHMRTHSGEKPYQCSVCGKSFADRSNMTLHHRLHSGIKPFNCPICPKAFTKKHHLKTHLNYHTGCKPYVCPHPNCHQAFTQSSNMRTHAKKCQYRPLQLQYPPPGGIGVSTQLQLQQSPPQSLTTISMNNGKLLLEGQQQANVGITVNTATISNVNCSNSNSSTNKKGSSISLMPSPNALTAGIRMFNTIASASLSAVASTSVSAPIINVGSTTITTMPTTITFPPTQQPLLSTLRQY